MFRTYVQFPNKLSKEHRARVKAVLADPRYESTIPGASASARDMRRLKGQDWLNDELINYIGVLINNRSDAADKDEKLRGEGEKRLRKTFVFNTNFFTMFGEQGFAKVKRWTRKVRFCSRLIRVSFADLPRAWSPSTVRHVREGHHHYPRQPQQ